MTIEIDRNWDHHFDLKYLRRKYTAFKEELTSSVGLTGDDFDYRLTVYGELYFIEDLGVKEVEYQISKIQWDPMSQYDGLPALSYFYSSLFEDGDCSLFPVGLIRSLDFMKLFKSPKLKKEYLKFTL